MNINELLLAMQKRPGMYVKSVSFDNIIDYIDAFLSTKRICGINDCKDDYFSSHFPSWVCKYFNMDDEYSRNWDKIIYLNSYSDEDAVEKLFSLSFLFFDEKEKRLNDAENN
ncbi:hypothetical protein EYY86_02015 [Hafnia paralvei]|jgi:hypothetical protein|uniref:hypothetical protein n=1 Tax=Hafnia paralvei TaxID=546367 RepID=UPI0010354D67|nr:hypothetical protein [Hafnia paralvei]TBM19377.1 hypothetical protein EYY86_02015 [Hafnia paralvei]TBM25468.1 hypothetical protein EYY85_12940 [Hafnia paralvei]